MAPTARALRWMGSLFFNLGLIVVSNARLSRSFGRFDLLHPSRTNPMALQCVCNATSPLPDDLGEGVEELFGRRVLNERRIGDLQESFTRICLRTS